MKIFKKTKKADIKKDVAIGELSQIALTDVVGGINPQPLPPGHRITL